MADKGGPVREVIMPAHGMAMKEGVLVRWLKETGEHVDLGTAIAEIETDKTTAEIESPVAGRLGAHLFEPGAVIPVGIAVCHVIVEGDAQAEPEAAPDYPTKSPVHTSTPRHFRRPARVSAELPTRPVDDRKTARGRDASTREVALPDLAGVSIEVGLNWLATMLLIREFETAFESRVPTTKTGGIHSAAGQEAVAVGSISALDPLDIVAGTHRSHHHALAKGLTPREVMAELYGKRTGSAGGRGGHMHVADFSKGFFGANGIVGGGLGIATGAALAFKMRGLSQVAVGFFGEGGASTGRVWEAVNLAALWKLPLIAICENNFYAVQTYVSDVLAAESVASRAAGFGLPAVQIDGQDIATVHRVISEARERAVNGDGPTFVEANTYRYTGHGVGEKETYRSADEVAWWKANEDPIQRLRLALEAADGLSGEEFNELQSSARRSVDDAIQFAEDSPWPDTETVLDGVYDFPVDVSRNQ